MMLSGTEKSRQKSSGKGNTTVKKIGLMGCWGFGNMGNLSHQMAMIQNIGKYYPDAQLYGFSVYPEVTEAIHGIPCFPFYRRPDSSNRWWIGDGKNFLTASLNKVSVKLRSIPNSIVRKLFIPIRLPVELTLEILALARSFKSLKGLDMLIIAGGGHFDDVYDTVWALPYAVFIWSLMARLRGVNFLVVSNGAGPINRPMGKIFFRQALSSASYRSFRDDSSKEYVERVLNFYRESDPIYPDLAHSLDLTHYQMPLQVRDDHRTIVGIAPVPHRYAGTLPGLPGGYTPTYLGYLDKLASFVEWLLQNRYIISFFTFEEGVDRLAIQDLKQTLDKNGIIYSKEQIIEQPIPTFNQSTFDSFMAQLSATDLFVASRFHGVLLPQLLNKPTLALSFAKKTDCLMADTGQSEYCLSIDQFDVETLKKRFAALEANQKTIKEQLAKRTHRYRKKLDEQYARLFGNQ